MVQAKLVGAEKIKLEKVKIPSITSHVREDFTTALELIHQGKVRVRPLISHHFTLEEIDKAFQKILAMKEEILKVLVQI